MSAALELDGSVCIRGVLASVLIRRPDVYWGTDFDSQRRMVDSTLSAATPARDKVL